MLDRPIKRLFKAVKMISERTKSFFDDVQKGMKVCPKSAAGLVSVTALTIVSPCYQVATIFKQSHFTGSLLIVPAAGTSAMGMVVMYRLLSILARIGRGYDDRGPRDTNPVPRPIGGEKPKTDLVKLLNLDAVLKNRELIPICLDTDTRPTS